MKNCINPNGYQWFDLSNDDPDYILGSLKSEKVINKFINEVKKYNLSNSQICIAGFQSRVHDVYKYWISTNEKFGCIVGLPLW